MTWYSLNKFEVAINEEIEQKTKFNQIEIINRFESFYNELGAKLNRHLSDNSLLFYLTRSDTESLLNLTKKWILQDNINKVSLYDQDGKLLLSSYRSRDNTINEIVNEDREPVFISPEFMESLGDKKISFVVDIKQNQNLEFVVFSKVFSPQKKVAGYLQETLLVKGGVLSEISKAMGGAKIIIHKPGLENRLVSDRSLYKINIDKWKDDKVDILLKSEEYTFTRFKLRWGDDWVYAFLGLSKKSYEQVLKNVLTSFMTVLAGIVFILVVLAFLISVILLKPLKTLLHTLRNNDPGEKLIELPIETSTELGLLTESFNQMFKRIYSAQKQMKKNIVNLEGVNTEIKDTQTMLVHNEKMASLGQLVAGVAHELNNPIGFIHSNMGHLREYANALVNIIEEGAASPKVMTELKDKHDYDFIVKDLPKLIQSCEDGAQRTRDIVLGLRNFSRIEEAKLKEVDITEGIERTLDLLKGELKSKVTVKKVFAKAPLINCYPSQLNQVFMNIIVNAIHAIPDRGELLIKTQIVNKKNIEITFKDSGQGIDEKTKEKIFDPFFTTKDIGKGTGLGLSISYGIIQKHNGDIKVNSKLGEGTEFIVTLPIAGPENDDAKES